MADINQLQVQEFKNIFTGAQHNFGEFQPTLKDFDESPQKINGSCRTITDQLLTIKNYKDHLNGIKGLGVIPITETNESSFFVMDIDIYDADLSIYTEAVERGSFPLVPFRSKSGGLHLYLFLENPESNIKKVVELMRKLTFLLSLDTLVKERKNSMIEIFPKQTFLNLKKNEIGSWINLPYFNEHETFQYAIRNNTPLTLNEALSLIKEKRTSLEKLQKFIDNLAFNDAPPCLQRIYFLNPLEKNSGRNSFLFSFAIYLKKKNEDLFEFNLKEVNDSLRHPLDFNEVEHTILKSLRKKDYIYKCKESPCCDFCHKRVCKQREFGIGKEKGFFSSVELGQLYQYKGYSPYYEWDVRIQGQEHWTRIRFKSEKELINQDIFLELCIEKLYIAPPKLKQSEWLKIINQFLKEIGVIDVPEEDDTSPFVLLKIHLTEFATARFMAETREDILKERVFFDDFNYLFRVKDFIKYLEAKQFKVVSPQKIHGLLRDLNCSFGVITVKGQKAIRVAKLPMSALTSLKDVEPEDVIFPNEEAF